MSRVLTKLIARVRTRDLEDGQDLSEHTSIDQGSNTSIHLVPSHEQSLHDNIKNGSHSRSRQLLRKHDRNNLLRLLRSHNYSFDQTTKSHSRAGILDRLFTVPPEIQLAILSYLTFGDIERLRRTSRSLRTRLSPPLIRSLFYPNFDAAVLGTCRSCLVSDPDRTLRNTLRGEETDKRWPLASRCFDCALKEGDLVVGRKYMLGSDGGRAWVCRWCGSLAEWDASWNQPEFHVPCYRAYNAVLVLYLLVGFAQWITVFIAAALCWAFRKGDMLTVPPTIVAFFMSTWVLILTAMRGPALRTYHWAFLLECAILALWTLPIYSISRDIRASPHKPSSSMIITLLFISLNMIFRLINAVGYLTMVLEYKFWRRKKRRTMPGSKRLNYFLAILVLWAYPQSLEQDYPASWWPSRIEEF